MRICSPQGDKPRWTMLGGFPRIPTRDVPDHLSGYLAEFWVPVGNGCAAMLILHALMHTNFIILTSLSLESNRVNTPGMTRRLRWKLQQGAIGKAIGVRL